MHERTRGEGGGAGKAGEICADNPGLLRDAHTIKMLKRPYHINVPGIGSCGDDGAKKKNENKEVKKNKKR